MGYQRENLTWPQDPLVFGMRWTSMIWKEKFNSQTTGICKHDLNNKELFDRQG